MEPEVFDYVKAGESVDWSGGRVPAADRRRAGRSTATSPRATGRTSARTRATSRRRPTCWRAASTSTSTASRCRPASGSPRAPRSTPTPSCAARCTSATTPRSRPAPSCASTRCWAATSSSGPARSCTARSCTTTSSSARTRTCAAASSARTPTSCAAARIEEGAVIGDECVIEEEAIISAGVKVYPFKTIEAGAVIHSSVIWESRGQRSLFGARGVSGIVNVEITPELVVRLTSAYATTLDKGATVVTGAGPLPRRPRAQARRHQRADVERLQRARPRGVAVAGDPAGDGAGGCRRRHHAAHHARASGQRGHPVPGRDAVPTCPAAQVRKVERIFQRQEFRRAFPGEIGDLSFPPRVVESYVQELRASIDTSRRRRGRAQGRRRHRPAASRRWCCRRCWPARPSRCSTVNNRLDDDKPTETAAARAEALRRLGELVASSRADVRRALRPGGRAALDRRRHAVGRSTTSARCWWSSTWSPPSAAAAGWRCR